MAGMLAPSFHSERMLVKLGNRIFTISSSPELTANDFPVQKGPYPFD